MPPKDVMTPEAFAKYMKKHSQPLCLSNIGVIDRETSHRRMDALMCRVLEDLGYGEGVKVFKKTPKWYA